MTRTTSLFFAAALVLAGCQSFDPVGTYQGIATRSGQKSTMVTNLQPDGTLTADTNRFNDSLDYTYTFQGQRQGN